MLLNLFYSYGYKYCFLPLFVACIYGKPFFLMKIIHYLLNITEKRTKTSVFWFLFFFLSFSFVVNFASHYYSVKNLKVIFNDPSITADLHRKASISFKEERNMVLFLSSICILVAIRIFTERYYSVNDYKVKLEQKKRQLNVLSLIKNKKR